MHHFEIFAGLIFVHIILFLQHMIFYPDSALNQLEFSAIKVLLKNYCQTENGKQRAEEIRVHTRKDYIDMALQQSHEYKMLVQQSGSFPYYTLQLSPVLKILGIAGSVLSGEEFMSVHALCENMKNIFRWFDADRKSMYTGLYAVIEHMHYEKEINKRIEEILDENGVVKDSASDFLQKTRMSLYRRRQELSRTFDKIIARLRKAGYSADIDESFSNGRRVVAVLSEYKRSVKGILHGESDTRKTTFIEPEETVEINNAIYLLEQEERKETLRILRALTGSLRIHAPLLQMYNSAIGEYDFIRAKALLAIDMNAHYPHVTDKACIHLIDAYHPLLYLYNKNAGKPTIPVSISLHDKKRILIISGPNAGGKTVTMKTIGLNQVMMQSGLLVPVQPGSEMGIFKKLFIHIGDTQSLQFELSTYSSHLLHMKYFLENAGGKTLFFIDELGSGSDPSLGGSFAEVILEELAHKHAIGVVTTHYLNLKIMANRMEGLINGAMAFDEVNLQPLYQLAIGKPGSSYTFAIAERIGLPRKLIDRARTLVDENHFRLDKLLNQTEQGLQLIAAEKKKLAHSLHENAALKKKMEIIVDKEQHRQKVDLLAHQNKITLDKIAYLKDMELRLRQIILEWKKTEHKEEVIQQIKNLLFKTKETAQNKKAVKKTLSAYKELEGEIKMGATVKMKKNHQVGKVLELRNKRAIIQVGALPLNVLLEDLVLVQKKE